MVKAEGMGRCMVEWVELVVVKSWLWMNLGCRGIFVVGMSDVMLRNLTPHERYIEEEDK